MAKKKTEQIIFESKEYGIGGHNKLEVRFLEDGDLRIWVRDGERNSLICMDRADYRALAKALTDATPKVPTTVESSDFSKTIHRNKRVKTTTQKVSKKRKTRSDKGKKRTPKKKVYSSPGDVGTYEDMKQKKIEEALS